MTKTTYFFNLPTLGIKDKDFNTLPFGQQLEYFRKIEEYKKSAKSVHISQKHRSTSKALKEFKDLYQPKSFFCKNTEGEWYKDDSIEVFYTE